MALTFPSATANLIYGGQQWYDCNFLKDSKRLNVAQLKGDEFATVTAPPNHPLFRNLPTNQLGQLSPLLERHLQAKNTNTSPTSVINFNIPPEVVHLLRPQAVPAIPGPTNALAPAPLILPHVAAPAYSGTTGMLIPGDRVPGPDLTLAEFCLAHRLTDGVRNKLEENGYSGSHTFQYAQWEELWEAGLKAGEIAQLKHAILMWSTL